MRWVLSFFLTLALLALGAPYLAHAINWSMGTTTVVFTGADGAKTSAVIGPAAPQPEWVPREPGAVLVSAARWIVQPGFKDSGDIELLTHSSVETLKRYYGDVLSAQGFTVVDYRFAGLNPLTEAYLGIAATLVAQDKTRRLEAIVHLETASAFSLFGARLVKIEWRELWPGQESPFARLGGDPAKTTP